MDTRRVRQYWHGRGWVVAEAGDNCLGWARLWNIREMGPEMNRLGLLCGLWGSCRRRGGGLVAGDRVLGRGVQSWVTDRDIRGERGR